MHGEGNIFNNFSLIILAYFNLFVKPILIFILSDLLWLKSLFLYKFDIDIDSATPCSVYDEKGLL